MAQIEEHKTVMMVDQDRTRERDEEIWFTNDDGESDLVEDFKMDLDVWTRMGRPHIITLRVVSGDTLNPPDDDDLAVPGIGGSPVEQ